MFLIAAIETARSATPKLSREMQLADRPGLQHNHLVIKKKKMPKGNYGRHLYEDNVPVPRRTAYRRRIEQQRAELIESSESEPDVDNNNAAMDMGKSSSGNNSQSFGSEIADSMSEGDLSGQNQDNNVNNIDHSNYSNNTIDSEYQEESEVSEEFDCREEGDDMQESDREEVQLPRPSNENVLDHNLNNVLCPCTTTTEGDALLMCLSMAFRHNMTWVAVQDMLKMTNVLFSRDVIRSSIYYLKKIFEIGNDTTVIHMYCSNCESYLGTKSLVLVEEILQCQNCEEAVNHSSYFVSVKLADQFKKFMEIPGIAEEILKYRFERKKGSEEAIEDIFDGNCYKNLFENGGPLSHPVNISVTLNTDGLSIGNTSSQSAWPIFLSVNELSPENRKKHVIFAGIWVGKKQPNMRIFLRPLIDDLKSLITNGFTWKNVAGEEIISRVYPIIALLDSGARYKFVNLSSYSSYYGCTFCYQRATNTPKGRRFTIRNEPTPLRTQESCISDMTVAHENRNHPNKKMHVHRGCKGFTPLVLLKPYFDLGNSLVVDYMHNGLLGVTRQHMYQDLKVVSVKKLYIGEPDKLHLINERLLLIKPPSSITRTPRDMTDIKLWRAHEWRSFLLFYGLACMIGVMENKNLEHFAMLSSAFYLLLRDSVSLNDLETSHTYLLQYMYLTQQYYGDTAMTYNIHLLSHVVPCVRNWGPLWAVNMFMFEGENRHLRQMLTSPGRVALQLTRRYLTLSAFPKYVQKYSSSERPVRFAEEITQRKLQSVVVCEGIVLCGSGHPIILSKEECRSLSLENIQLSNNNATSYEKMILSGVRLTCKTYSQNKKNDDSWIKIKDNKRGQIEKILRVPVLEGHTVVVMVRVAHTEEAPFLRTQRITVKHIKRLSRMSCELKAVLVENIKGQCINMDLDCGHFLTDMPYGCYGD